ncbi:hypothetical protein [Glycomyces tritici]|uniref:Immunity protein 63 domain-containing protein n=1 Tax=Glycomyces tritici TaxID=2665176 RepID=A0ABT7YYV8_9ACTN|nr:hypothetical protein [Glycomyces tritici]MDN3243834.1 hypothetical protein [Glycomyces tritici]
MDDYFGPVAVDPVEAQQVLAGWICTDIGVPFRILLDALAMIDDVAHGRPPYDEWSSEGYAVAFTPSGVSIRSLHGDRRSATYSVEEVRSALEDFWAFRVRQPERANVRREFRPDLPEWKADLLRWEDTFKQRHPYRGRLGIPAGDA